jgi:hypothetical protein
MQEERNLPTAVAEGKIQIAWSERKTKKILFVLISDYLITLPEARFVVSILAKGYPQRRPGLRRV